MTRISAAIAICLSGLSAQASDFKSFHDALKIGSSPALMSVSGIKESPNLSVAGEVNTVSGVKVAQAWLVPLLARNTVNYLGSVFGGTIVPCQESVAKTNWVAQSQAEFGAPDFYRVRRENSHDSGALELYWKPGMGPLEYGYSVLYSKTESREYLQGVNTKVVFSPKGGPDGFFSSANFDFVRWSEAVKSGGVSAAGCKFPGGVSDSVRREVYGYGNTYLGTRPGSAPKKNYLNFKVAGASRVEVASGQVIPAGIKESFEADILDFDVAGKVRIVSSNGTVQQLSVGSEMGQYVVDFKEIERVLAVVMRDYGSPELEILTVGQYPQRNFKQMDFKWAYAAWSSRVERQSNGKSTGWWTFTLKAAPTPAR